MRFSIPYLGAKRSNRKTRVAVVLIIVSKGHAALEEEREQGCNSENSRAHVSLRTVIVLRYVTNRIWHIVQKYESVSDRALALMRDVLENCFPAEFSLARVIAPSIRGHICLMPFGPRCGSQHWKVTLLTSVR